MTSSELIHPGEMIKDEIIARGLTQKELAQQMGVSYTVFNEILNGKRPVTTEYALLLEAALGTNASIWIRLQTDYNMQKAKQDKSFMKRLEKIRKIAYRIVERRPGDPATLVANPSKAHEVLGWKAQYSDLETLLATTWRAYLANEK